MLDFLSVVWNVDPIICKIGPVALRYYSLLFIAGFPLGYWLFIKFYKRAGLDEKLLEPLLYALLIGTIVGARLGHCLFYESSYFLTAEHWTEIFQPWKGGLASHGGAIGVLLAVWWYTAKYGRKWNFDMLWLLDRLVIAVAFAGCFIRLGNLFNSEIYGDVTDLPWGFIFALRGETLPKHPTQIYEALTYLVLGLILLWTYFKRIDKVHKGWFLGVFFIGCFGMRFLIEFIKEPQEGFEENMVLNMGQLLSIPFIVAGVWFIVRSIVRKEPSERTKPVRTNYCPPPKSARKKESVSK
ncbi:MAG: prolipoprotein diacylglyceryl transferase [Bacteroidales bacterium]|nr:prolipoprotein diacylglyceryl transferase [Candidatus Cacconaster merdequi]